MSLAPLRNTSTRPPDGTLRAPATLAASCWIALRRMAWSEAIPITADSSALPAMLLKTSREISAHSERPFRRPSGIGVSGVERHGCRESRDGPGMALRSGPLKLRWSEGTPAKPGPDAGARPFGSFWGRAFAKRDSPEGEKQNLPAHAEATQNPPYENKNIADKVRSYRDQGPPPHQEKARTTAGQEGNSSNHQLAYRYASTSIPASRICASL